MLRKLRIKAYAWLVVADEYTIYPEKEPNKKPVPEDFREDVYQYLKEHFVSWEDK